MKRLIDLSFDDLSNKRVLLRADLNVPLEHGRVANDYRIRKTLPTIEFLQAKGAKVIILSHIGRDPHESLAPVAVELKKHLPMLRFVPDVVGAEAQQISKILEPGNVILLENVRREPGEESSEPGFARELARLADIYVNDAFAVAHREHASVVGVPRHLPSYAGLLFAEEFDHLSHARSPDTPAIAIIGGAKFETKEPLIASLLKSYEGVFVGGAIANDLMKARNVNVGKSLVSKESPSPSIVNEDRIVTMYDCIVKRADGMAMRKSIDEIADDDVVVDVGPDTVMHLASIIAHVKFVLWNGPLGLYEEGFDDATTSLAEVIAQSKAKSVVGGGDTVAAIEKLHLQDKFTFLSTAGGAMLDFLLDGSLPGIEALK